MQSPVVTERVAATGDGRVRKLLDSCSDDGRVVEEMFLGTLARLPSDEERKIALEALARNRREGAENLQWALVNLVDFFFNY
jgi:hypothetical protein